MRTAKTPHYTHYRAFHSHNKGYLWSCHWVFLPFPPTFSMVNISSLLWLHFMSVLPRHALKHDRKYTTVPKSLSQGSWRWGREIPKREPLGLQEAKSLEEWWCFPRDGVCFHLPIYLGSCHMAAGRRSRQYHGAAPGPEKPSDLLNPTQLLNSRTHSRIQKFPLRTLPQAAWGSSGKHPRRKRGVKEGAPHI